MRFWNDIKPLLVDGCILDIRMGLNWTAVVVEVEGEVRCGLASTLKGDHKHTGEATIPGAGGLIGGSALAAAAMIQSQIPPRVSLGMAVINALLERQPETWTDQNVEKVLVSLGKDRPIALVGHFPFVPRLRQVIDRFEVIDRYPLTGDHPESAAPDILPKAGVVAITGMTMLNGTFDSLMSLCSPEATVLLLGPSTPHSPVMFDYGVDILAGSIVTNIEAVLRAVSQGANFRQVKAAGVRLVTVARPGF